MPCYSYEGLRPVVDPGAFVHPTAVLIGDVVIAGRCYIGPGASLRGDFGRIRIGEGCNFQDNTVAHTFPGADVVVEADGHIGHGAVLHGCKVGRNALIGMNSIIMDGAVIGEDSFVGAMSFVKANFEAPPRHLVMGSPARLIRPLSEAEIESKSRGTRQYHELAQRSLATLFECEPLTAVEADRLGRARNKAPPADHKRAQNH